MEVRRIMPKPTDAKVVELWDGYSVTVNEKLMDDFDFITDLQKAYSDNDIGTLVEMYMAVIGGEDVYMDVRAHIEAEEGYFSQTLLLKIIEKIDDAFPKSGSRAQRRSWKTTR